MRIIRQLFCNHVYVLKDTFIRSERVEDDNHLIEHKSFRCCNCDKCFGIVKVKAVEKDFYKLDYKLEGKYE